MSILTHSTENSSRITGMTYDTVEQELKIDFKRGGSYKYYEVSLEIFNTLKTAPSIGKVFNDLIIHGGFRYEQVSE